MKEYFKVISLQQSGCQKEEYKGNFSINEVFAFFCKSVDFNITSIEELKDRVSLMYDEEEQAEELQDYLSQFKDLKNYAVLEVAYNNGENIKIFFKNEKFVYEKVNQNEFLFYIISNEKIARELFHLHYFELDNVLIHKYKKAKSFKTAVGEEYFTIE